MQSPKAIATLTLNPALDMSSYVDQFFAVINDGAALCRREDTERLAAEMMDVGGGWLESPGEQGEARP